MTDYNPQAIEKKWQEAWDRAGAFATTGDPEKEKAYILVEFPYPSGNGLHVGHTRPYTAESELKLSDARGSLPNFL